MKIARFGLSVLLGVTTVFADESKPPPSKPKSLSARTAIEKCDQTIAEAEKVRRKAEFDAKYKMNIELRRSQQNALKDGDQEEALAIAQKIKATEDELAKTKEQPRLADRLIAQKNFTYWWGTREKIIGRPPRLLELLADGRIGQGADTSERSWKVSGQTIVIAGEAGSVELVECVDGSFRGASQISGAAATLEPKR